MGGGGKAVPFKNEGDSHTVLITGSPEKRQQTDYHTRKPKFFDDGKPKWMWAVPVQTELRDPQDPWDTGARQLFLQWKSLEAVRLALRTVGAQGLRAGGLLTLTLTGLAPGPEPRAKIGWSASYIPPTEEMAPIVQAPPAAPAQNPYHAAPAVLPTLPPAAPPVAQPVATPAQQAGVMERLRAQAEAGRAAAASRPAAADQGFESEPPF